jgi:hypothetical protein
MHSPDGLKNMPRFLDNSQHALGHHLKSPGVDGGKRPRRFP